MLRIVYNKTLGYFIHGKFHREDGPAMIYPSGRLEYYLNGIEYTEDEFKLIKFLS